MTTTTMRRPGAAIGNALLTLAAIGGVLCIVFVVLAVVFHVTLIMFKTGSMSPTIPTGSLAVVKQVGADEIAVGDIITVDRQDALPITHRVTSIEPLGAGAVSITMRGDANPAEDPAPYVVTTARKVLFSVPGLAYVVASTSNPIALGGISLGAAAVVTWAFWPRHERELPLHRRRAGTHTSARVRHAAIALAALAAGASIVVPAPAARAAVTEETIVGEFITLVSISDRAAMSDLQPGVPVDWQIGISVDPGLTGTVTLSLAGAGALVSDPRGLWLSVDTCGVRWVGAACATGGTSLMALDAAAGRFGAPIALATMPTTVQLWVLVRSMVPNAPLVRSGSANLSIIASGSGDIVVAGTTPGAIAYTGADVQTPLRAALGAVILGLGLAFAARLRQSRRARAGLT